METTVFDRILAGEIPAKRVYEDAHTLAFHDVNPQAPIHVIVIPKKKIAAVSQAADDDALALGRVLLTARKVAELLGVDRSGFRLVLNDGEHGGQTVAYLHCHVLGGRALGWPPG